MSHSFGIAPALISIADAVRDVLDGRWRLPDFQRPPRWQWAKQRSLLHSLYKDYPIGMVLIWGATPERVWRPFEPFQLDGAGDPEYLVLDGQQRLSFLASLTARALGLQFDDQVGEVVFRAEQEDFQKSAPHLRHDPATGVVSLAQLLRPTGGKAVGDQLPKESWKAKVQQVRYMLTERVLPVQGLQKRTELGHAVHVYQTMNRAGTTLSAKDHAYADLCMFWPRFEREIRTLEDDLTTSPSGTVAWPALGRDTIIKCLLDELFGTTVSTVTSRAVAEGRRRTPRRPVHVPTKGEVASGFSSVRKSLILCKRLLHEDLLLDSSRGLAMNPIVVASAYLRVHEAPTAHSLGQLLHWFVWATLRNHYTGGSTDKKVDGDCKTARSAKPWDALFSNMGQSLSPAPLHPALTKRDFGAVGARPLGKGHILNSLRVSLARYMGATDWIDSTILTPSSGGHETHHIFPKALVGNKAYAEHAANLSTLNAGTNRWIRSRSPSEYLAWLAQANEPSLRAQLVPVHDASLWRVDRIQDFLNYRSESLASGLNGLLNRFRDGTWREQGPQRQSVESLESLVAHGETQRIEFKETAFWSVREHKKDKAVTKAIAKAVASMANVGGGTVLIGVSDKASVVGLDPDLSYFRAKGRNEYDQLRTHVTQVLNHHLTAWKVASLVDMEFHQCQGKDVFVLKVRGAEKPIPVRNWHEKGDRVYLIRIASSTEQVDGPQFRDLEVEAGLIGLPSS